MSTSNNSEWTPQAARGVALTGRVPAHSLGTFIVATVGGAVYRSAKYNGHASRGRIKVDRTQAALVPGYTGEDANFFWQAMWPVAALASLNTAYPLNVRQELAAFAGGDSYAPLTSTPAYQNHYNEISGSVIPGNGPSSHLLPLMLATGHAMGVEAYNQWHDQPLESNLHGAFNVSAKYNIFDSENYATPAGQDTFVLTARQAAGVQQGMIDAYNQDTRTPATPYTAATGTKPAYAPVWITNALESFSSNAHFFSDADPDGNPHYFNLQPAAYRDAGLIASLQATGGYMSIEPYMKCIWHESKSLYQYNSDGTVKMLNGQPVFNRTGYSWTESGFTFTVDQGEGEHLLHEIQRYLGVVQAARKQINGGTMPVRFSDRMAGASNVGLAPWLRPTNERGNYIPGVTVSNPNNNRPVPGWITEGLLIMTGIMTGWKGLQLMFSSFFGNNASGNVPDPGEKNWNDDDTGETDQGTDGSREYAYKAWHRLSLLGDILTNDGKILSFGHHYRNSNTGTGDRFIEKIPVEGKICLHNGQMVILVAGFLPGQDLGKSTTVTLWVNTGAGARVVTTLTLYDRKVNWVIIPLPGDLTNIDARNVYAAYSDMIGGVNNVIKTGELNYPVPAGTTVPAAGGSVTPAPTPAGSNAGAIYARNTVQVGLAARPNNDSGNVQLWKDLMLLSSQKGCNHVSVWYDVSNIFYNGFGVYDQVATYAAGLGMKMRANIYLNPQSNQIGVAPTSGAIPTLPSNVVRAVNYDGSVQDGPGLQAELSVYDSVANTWALNTVSAIADHILAQGYASSVNMVGVVKSYSAEMQYSTTNYPNNVATGVLYGYDAPALASWQAQYGAVPFPQPAGASDLNSAFNGATGQAFYRHREAGLAGYLAPIYARLRQKNSNWALLGDVGSFVDSETPRRASANPQRLFGAYVDGRKSNGQVGIGNHEYWMDATAAGLGEAGFWADELDYSGDGASLSPGQQQSQLARSYKRGATLITIANLTDAGKLGALLDYSGNGIGKISDAIAAGPVRVARTASITVSLADQARIDNNNQYNQWVAAAGSNYQNWVNINHS